MFVVEDFICRLGELRFQYGKIAGVMDLASG